MVKNESVVIKLMGRFSMIIGQKRIEDEVLKSKKGAAFMWRLILQRDDKVYSSHLLETLWLDEQLNNPESALKTLVSRMRTLLNKQLPDLGACIVADRGGYRWVSTEDMRIDLYELQDALDELESLPEQIADDEDRDKRLELFDQVLKLYGGDLLDGSEQDWVLARAVALHNRYLTAVYKLIEIYKSVEDYSEIVRVCRTALEVDTFDEKLHLELMNALTKTNRSNEAMLQYKHVTRLHTRYLAVPPPQAILDFYKQITQASQTLEFNLETIRNELKEHDEMNFAFVCEYSVFKEIFNLQIRNLERLGSSMFLGLIMITDMNNKPLDPLKQSDIMQGTLEILKRNMRKGDTITQFNPVLFALLLPTVNYTTGNMVIDRIKRLFYRKYPNSNVLFHSLIGPLNGKGQYEN